MNNQRKLVVFGFIPHRVKHIVATMASLPAGLPAVLSEKEKPDTTEPAPAAAQSNVASEEKMDTSFLSAQSKEGQGKVKLSGAWSVDVLLRPPSSVDVLHEDEG
jgi:hypothetical protein